MSDAAPCLILRGKAVPYTVWNEDGRLICHSSTFGELDRRLRQHGYEPVPPNSRCGRTILDKIVAAGKARYTP